MAINWNHYQPPVPLPAIARRVKRAQRINNITIPIITKDKKATMTTICSELVVGFFCADLDWAGGNLTTMSWLVDFNGRGGGRCRGCFEGCVIRRGDWLIGIHAFPSTLSSRPLDLARSTSSFRDCKVDNRFYIAIQSYLAVDQFRCLENVLSCFSSGLGMLLGC